LQKLNTSLPEVWELQPKVLRDARGFFLETYHQQKYSDLGIPDVFVQDNLSMSPERGTVRGLHFQAPPRAQAKLVRVARGRIFDVVVDIRRSSPTFGRHCSVELGEESLRQLFVPAGFAHGFCTLEARTEVFYKTSDFYVPEAEGGIRWNDPALAINWPASAGASVSAKDQSLPLFAALNGEFFQKAAGGSTAAPCT
jgi:dTDP-4-dehydrorhamnose 3,5-epimerase